MVSIENLTKHFRGPNGAAVRAVEGATLEAADGEFLVLVGPSGSGKTTLLRLIAGLDRPDTGSIRINGSIVTQTPPEAREVAMVFQEHALYPHMTVRENLGFGLRLRKVPALEAGERVQETARLLDLSSLLERAPDQLSGGERQRVALGRALVLRPRVFLLDEPFSNLDAPLRTQLRRELVKIQRQLGVTTIYVTHDQQEAMALASRIAVLRDGAVQQIGTPRQIYREPANLFVAGFIGTPPINRIPGVLSQQDAHVSFISRLPQNADEPALLFPLSPAATALVKTRVGENVVLGLRPEHVQELQDACPVDQVQWTATAEAVEPVGSETHLLAREGPLAIMARLGPETRVRAGDRVRLGLRVAEARFFRAPGGERIG